MRLEGEPEIVLVLTEHIDKFLIVAAQSPSDLLKSVFHLLYVRFQVVDHWVVALVAIRKVLLDVVHKRFKNCTGKS